MNATRPGVAAPMPAPPRMPTMPMGYGAPQYPQFQPQPPVVVLQSAAKNIPNNTNKIKVGNVFSKIINNPIFSTVVIIWVTIFILYLFLNSDAGKGFMKNFSHVADAILKIAKALGIGAVAWGVWKVAPGLLSMGRKAQLLAEDAKAAREAGDLEKAEKLEKEAADAKAEAEAAGEEVKGVTDAGKEAKEAEEAAKLAKEAKAAAQEAEEIREAASFLRV